VSKVLGSVKRHHGVERRQSDHTEIVKLLNQVRYALVRYVWKALRQCIARRTRHTATSLWRLRKGFDDAEMVGLELVKRFQEPNLFVVGLAGRRYRVGQESPVDVTLLLTSFLSGLMQGLLEELLEVLSVYVLLRSLRLEVLQILSDSIQDLSHAFVFASGRDPAEDGADRPSQIRTRTCNNGSDIKRATAWRLTRN